MHEKQIVCGAYFIRTKTRYIHNGVRAYRGYSVAVAEAMAVGLAAEYLRKASALHEGDSVSFYIDSESALEFLQSAVNGSKKRASAKDIKARLAWSVVRELSQEYKVVLHKIYAHDRSWNGNSVADSLAKCGLSQAVWRLASCTP